MEKRVISNAVMLTERDLEILEFIIDMKFSSVQAVFKKFFQKTRSETEAKSQAWAQKRLFQLEKAKFLTAVYNFADRTKYYSGTFKSYYALKNLNPQLMLLKPTGSIDQRTFSHDKTVLDLRVLLEESGKSTLWISERKLKAQPELVQGLSPKYIPDGIYLTPSGEKIAFELEISTKAKERYREKVRRYVYLLRSSQSEKPFHRIQFVCATDIVRKHIERETKLYPQFFSVESLNQYFPNNK